VKKLFFLILSSFFFNNIVFATNYVLTCVSDKNFITVYSINETAKEIIHLSSKTVDGTQSWSDINKKLKIIKWSGNEVHTLNFGNSGSGNSFSSFDLKELVYINTGHYLSNPESIGYAYSALFKCVKG